MLVLEKSAGNKDSAFIRAAEAAPRQGHSPYSGTINRLAHLGTGRELAGLKMDLKEKKRAGEAPALLRFPGYGWDYSATVQ